MFFCFGCRWVIQRVSLKEKPGQFHGDRLRIPPTSGATLIKEKHLVPQESRVKQSRTKQWKQGFRLHLTFQQTWFYPGFMSRRCNNHHNSSQLTVMLTQYKSILKICWSYAHTKHLNEHTAVHGHHKQLLTALTGLGSKSLARDEHVTETLLELRWAALRRRLRLDPSKYWAISHHVLATVYFIFGSVHACPKAHFTFLHFWLTGWALRLSVTRQLIRYNWTPTVFSI